MRRRRFMLAASALAAPFAGLPGCGGGGGSDNNPPAPVPPSDVVLTLPKDMYLHLGAPTEWWWHIGTLRAGNRTFGFEINAASFAKDGLGFSQIMLSDVATQSHYQRTAPFFPPFLYNPETWAESSPSKPWYARLGGAWEAWMGETAAFRTRVATLLHAPRTDCVVPKTSAGQGLRAILNTFERDAVPRIVATRGEFDSLDVILREYARRGRVALTFVEADAGGLFGAQDVVDAIEGGTDLVVISQVMFQSGQVMPGLPEIVTAAHAAGARVLLDVYHSLGVFPVDLAALDRIAGERGLADRGCPQILDEADIGAGAAHVARNEIAQVGCLADPQRAGNATGRPGQDRAYRHATCGIEIHDPAAGRHRENVAAITGLAKLRTQRRHVAIHDG